MFKHDLRVTAPAAKAIAIQPVQRASDAQRAHAAEHLPGVALAARGKPERSVKVLTLKHVVYSGGDIQLRQLVQQRCGMQSGVEEAGVDLAPFVAGKRAV